MAAGWLFFAALASVTGVVLGRWLVLPGQEHSSAELRADAARLGRAAAAVLAVALALVFARQLLEFRDPFEPWSAEARLLLGGTPWGRTWLLGAGAALLAVAALHGAVHEVRWSWPAATAAVLALGAFPALTGHANGGGAKGLTLAADTLHVWAAGGWVGGLALVLALEGRHRRRRGDGPGLLPLLIPRFSRLATACVATLAATGLIASWIHVGSVGALASTAYGRLLIRKLALVAGVLGLGAYNFRVLTPRLGEPEGRSALRRAATLELLVGSLVLAVTAVLVRTSPP